MNEDKLTVFLYGKPVGVLERLKNLKLSFSYKMEVTTPLSLAMPLKEKTFDSHLCKVFFSGLLPESPQARHNLSRLLNLDQKDIFGFLKEMGQDCAGAVSLYPLGQTRELPESYPLSGRILSKIELEEYLSLLSTRQYWVGIDDLHATLSGMQDKGVVCLIDGKVAIAHHGCPSTHIIKVATSKKNTLLNEYICLKIAERIGIDIPKVELRRVGKILFMVIQRYDRVITPNHTVKRIHQEDFCQALGILPFRKYQYDGGPNLKDCFDLLKKTILPVVDRNRMMQIVIFNFLMANFFAHGKNFSLLYLPHNKFKLAPFYDLHCGHQEYEEGRFAMAICGQYNPQNITSSQWEHFCHKIGYSYPAFKKLFVHSMESILQAAELEKNETIKWKREKECEKIQSFLQRHCDKLSKEF